MPVPGGVMGVTIYSSLRGLVAAAVSPVVLLWAGVYGLVGSGGGLLPLALTVFGVVLAAVALLDYPRHSRFTRDGIERICFLRRQHIAWDDVMALERARGSVSGWLRAGGQAGGTPPPERAVNSGGLVARVGRRRYLLVDQRESEQEFERVRDLLERHAPAVMLRAPKPATDTPPSDLYRPRRNR